MMRRSSPAPFAMLILGIGVPIVLVALFIMIEHWDIFSVSKHVKSLPWQLIVALVILPGLIPISYLRLALKWRLAVGLIYFLVMFAAIPLFALVFACSFTSDCI